MTRYFNIHINTLLNVDPDEFLENATGTVLLTLPDGDVVETDHVSLAWTMFGMHYHRKYGTEFSKKHLFNQYIDEIGYRSSCWVKWINVIFWDTYDHVLNTSFIEDDRKLFTGLCKDFIYVYGKLYSAFISASRAYQLSVSLLDCYETFSHPEMMRLRQSAKEKQTPGNISKVIDSMKKLVSSPKKEIDNALSLIARIGAVRIPQVIQCVGLIGYRTEVNGDVYATPVIPPYLEGFTTPYGYMIESRTSCISELATYGELRSSEYSARKTQLALVNVRGIDHSDCGTKLTSDILVKAKDEYRDYLKELIGTNYLLPDGTYTWIRGDERHLEDTVIKIFTPLSCYYPKTHNKVCRKCYGKMSESHQRNLHLGYISAISSSSSRSQGSMGKKHSIGSANIVGLDFTLEELKFIRKETSSDYFINEGPVKEKMLLKIPLKEVAGLNNVLRDKTLRFTEESVSALKNIYFETVDKVSGYVELIPVKVSLLKNNSYLSYEFINYCRDISEKINLDAKGVYNIPLDEWDYKKPFIVMPAVNSADAIDIDAIYESLDGRLSALNKRGIANTTSSILAYVYDLLSPSGTHICDVAVTIMSILSEDSRECKFDIGRTGLESVPTPLMEKVMGMSAGTAMAFERQHILKVGSMLPTGRAGTPLDVVMVPSIVNHNRRT